MAIYETDDGHTNKRLSAVGQSFIYKLKKGDKVAMRLHDGGLKGAAGLIGEQFPFTSFLGMKIGGNLRPGWFPSRRKVGTNYADSW